MLKKDKYADIRPNQIGEQLPYFEFEENSRSPFYRVHLFKDGALGVAWKLTVPASYSQDQGHLSTNNEFRTCIEGLPPGYEIQTIITSHNNLANKMKEYLSLEAGDDRAKLLRQSRAEKYLEAGFNGYPVSEQGYSMLRETQMVVTLRTPQQEDRFGLFAPFMNIIFQIVSMAAGSIGLDMSKIASKLLDDTLKMGMSEFKEVLMSVENTLNGMFQMERMDRAALKEYYWTAMCPSYKDPGQKVMFDKNTPFSDQIFPLPVEHEGEIVKIGDDYHGVIMLAMMPDTVGPDYLGILRRTLATQYTFFCNMVQPNQLVEKTALTLSAALRKRVATAFSKEEAQVFEQEASEVRQRMFGGRKIMYAMVGVVVHGHSKEEVEDRILKLNAVFKKLSVVPDIERTMALQAISYSWPLVWRDKFTKPFARTRRVMSDDLVDLLPIHGHWCGHKNPQAIYINRDGEITFFDHTSNDFVNWHYAITGTSGSGKSFAVVDLALQLYAGGVEKQYLMTIKDDYDRFAKTLGKLILIDLDSQSSCINPFAGEKNKTRLQQWSQALELMLQKGSQLEADRDEQRLVEQIVEFAYDIVPEGDVLRPTWIREAFYKFPYISEAQRAIGMQNAQEIGSYCEDGIYGRLFDGFPSVTDEDKLVVFNLQNVLSEKISDVIIFSIFTMLDNVMYSGKRSERKHLLVDEMISMVSAKGGEAVANQLKRAFRTYRSLNCMCGIASQNEEDLTSEVGQAIIGNITKRLILKPRKEMIPMLMQSLSLRSDRHEANIASVDTKPGFYSEFYLMSPHGEVVCRLLTDKLTFALATTTPDDVAEINRMKEESGGDWWKATIMFAQKYPHGVRAAQAAKVKR